MFTPYTFLVNSYNQGMLQIDFQKTGRENGTGIFGTKRRENEKMGGREGDPGVAW